MLKSQKCSRWEAEGEREEMLQKLQVIGVLLERPNLGG